MEPVRKTQKQVAEKYKGNLAYFKKPGRLRRLRFWLVFFAFVIGATAIFLYVTSGEKTFYNTGPITSTHASLDCQSCHHASDGELVRDRLLPLLETWKKRVESGQNPFQEKPAAFFAKLDVDASCANCHEAQRQHAPQWFSLATRFHSSQIAMVDAGSCSSCHEEHAGPGPMKAADAASCIGCHNDASRLAQTAHRVSLPKNHPSSVAINAKLPDGAVHFLPPVPAGHVVKTFASFADGHPDFAYQAPGLKDPNVIRYNHKRHAQADIPQVDGRRMDCNSCHKLGSTGDDYLPVTFEANCVSCHALQFDPEHTELVLPHGKPDAARTYLRNLPYQYGELAKQKGLTNPAAARQFTIDAMTRLKQRVRSGEDFEKQVFLTSNPYRAQNPTGERAYFPGCVMCHEVRTDGRANYQIATPVSADRWLGKGRFNHAAHTHVSCVDCHAANASAETSDIIMPTQATCVECHRPLDFTPTSATASVDLLNAAAQKKHGGVRADCATCHRYHPDAQALSLLKELPPSTQR